MKKCQHIVLIGLCMMAFLCFSGCTTASNPHESHTDSSSSPSSTITGSEADKHSDTAADMQKQEAPNMVDERFELLSLVFRLAGRAEYGEVGTPYQQELISEFSPYQEHDAVQYAANLPLGYDAVFQFSVHLQKSGDEFVFTDDIDSLVEDGRWTRQSAADFLVLLNNFYTETGFSAFYQSHIDFYKAETQIFIDNVYANIDLTWFDTYVDPDNLRCIYSPSNTRHNYSATVNGTVVYCAVSGQGAAIVHEYCHSFANPIAHTWYEENPEFRTWCDKTVDPVKLPAYQNGKTIAGEYVTRAYNTLYYAEHGYALPPIFLEEKSLGFPYIEEVYGLITSYEKPKLGPDKIKNILGVDYEMGEEKSSFLGNREIRWRVLSLSEPLSQLFRQTQVGNAFGSSTGDVLYLEDTGDNTSFLLIDLGETTFRGQPGYRKYSRIPIE